MNVHEYQGKSILKELGAPVLAGMIAFTPEEATQAAHTLAMQEGTDLWVVKAQIHAGGRGKGHFKEQKAGKAGGVRLAKSVAEVGQYAQEMLGNHLITQQTSAEGKEVGRVYIEAGCAIERELYLSVLIDRASSRVCFVASTQGGMDIEEVAHNTPEKIINITIDPATGFMPHHGRALGFALTLTGSAFKQIYTLGKTLYEGFLSKDMSLLEINPLIVSTAGNLCCLDAKMSFDANALSRHPDVQALRDVSEENAKEIEASRHGLAYIALEGTIGCMVNGAGLAMATMDIIKHYGEEPANFLDVGGGASAEKVKAAVKIITADTNVKGILINIFGGIMRCDIIAEGVIAAVAEVGLHVPTIVRLEGTNAQKGKDILAASTLNIIPADDLDDAAQKIIAAIRK